MQGPTVMFIMPGVCHGLLKPPTSIPKPGARLLLLTMSSERGSEGNRVIIIGAGVGGIAAAIALKTQLKTSNFKIYDAGSDVGGTWRDNVYPGCSSDVYTHWYSLSIELNPDWDTTHVHQPQLLKYLQDVTRKYSLYDQCVFHTEVIAATWDASHQVWRVELKNLKTGSSFDTAKAVISSVGILCVPRYPRDLDGVKTRFKGQYFHSARWNYDVDLRNKRVAVIGNGCSAAQFLPIIAEEPTTHIVNFWRTPMWYFPSVRRTYTAIEKWAFRNIPFVMRLYRWSIFLWQESIWLLVVGGRPNHTLRLLFQKYLTSYMKKLAPKRYHEVLKPDYPFACKRLVVDTGYYSMLHRPNVSLVKDNIADIVEEGILTKNGELIPFDVIILATGFVVDNYPFTVRGKKGITLQEYYDQHGGPTAYLGTTIPGFPNFFMLGGTLPRNMTQRYTDIRAGPNTNQGHGSVIFTEECQVSYITQFLKPILQGEVSSFDVTEKAADAYNERLQRRLNASVWSACQSWYRVGQTGKISSIWPGMFVEYWWAVKSPKWGDYEAVGAEEWQRRRKSDTIVFWCGLLAGGVAAVLWEYLQKQG
ncbi:FAD/NAD-binding domain-containing protein [Panus rudis PR-1116 ss-1]|nr:FAD/NAD-binding domain-containing protein [Panus rudis PR-1116 ss-1]